MAVAMAVVGGMMAGYGILQSVPPLQRWMQYTSNTDMPNAVPPFLDTVEAYRRGIIDAHTEYVWGLNLGFNGDVQHVYEELDRKQLSPEILTRLYIRKAITKKDLMDKMNRLGYKGADYYNYILAMKSLPDPMLLLTAYFRGLIKSEEFNDGIEKLGYDKEVLNLIIESNRPYPNHDDFIRFAVRDVFRPDRVKKYKLDIEFPEEIIPYAQKTGMKEEWLKWYWMAHWELPSPEMVMRMVNILQPKVLNTTLPDGTRYGDKYKIFGIDPDNVITTYDDMSEYLAMADISPYWRDRMKALTFPPITRVDLRRLYKYGIISVEELFARLLELGYSELDAGRMVQFYNIYKMPKERDLTKSEIIKLYEEKFITKDNAKNLLMNLGYDEDEALYIIDLSDYKLGTEDIKVKINTISILYVKGLITRDEAYSEMCKLNLPDTKLQSEMDKMDYKKLRAMKLPPKKDLDEMFMNNIINESEYREALSEIGFSDVWIERYVKLIKG